MRLNLVDKSGKGLYQIFLSDHINGERIRWYTGFRIKVTDVKKDWENNRSKKKSDFHLNSKLKRIENIYYEILEQLKTGRKLNAQNVKSLLGCKSIFEAENYISEIQESIERLGTENKTFFEAFDEWIEISRSTKTESTVKQLNACKNNLALFEGHIKKDISFKDIDPNFYDSLVSFYFNELDMSNNTVGNQIKNLKAFLHWIIKRYKIKLDISEFKVLRERTTIIYHSQEELERIYKLDFPSDEELKEKYNAIWQKLYKREFPGRGPLLQGRDLHVFECQTSLRVSDRKRLSKEHIFGSVIKMTAYKNKKSVFIPLTPIARQILEKYDYKLPAMSDVRTNEYIKAICLIAGIDYEVETVEYKGGNKIYTKTPKWQLITNHTAVKTFISHCGEKGISAKIVSEITGKTVKVIQDHYYGTSNKVIQMEMERAFGSGALKVS